MEYVRYVEFWADGALLVTLPMTTEDLDLLRREAERQLGMIPDGQAALERLRTATVRIVRSFGEV